MKPIRLFVALVACATLAISTVNSLAAQPRADAHAYPLRSAWVTPSLPLTTQFPIGSPASRGPVDSSAAFVAHDTTALMYRATGVSVAAAARALTPNPGVIGIAVRSGLSPASVPPPSSAWVVVASGTTETLDSVACPTMSMCVAVGYGGTALVSMDAGRTWVVRFSDSRDLLRGVTCPTSRTCIAVGNRGMRALILATSDGGVTWREQHILLPWLLGETEGGQGVVQDVTCTSARNCLAVGWGGHGEVGLGVELGVILVSTDGGVDWRQRASGTPHGLGGIACPTTSRCLVAGDAGTVLISTDAGAHWKSMPSGTTSYLGSIVCPTTKECRAVGEDGTFLASSDSGATWTAHSNPQPDPYDKVLALTCSSSGACLAVGDGGIILAAAAGSTTWLRRASGTSVPLLGVTCRGDRRCLVVGAYGTILASTDGIVG